MKGDITTTPVLVYNCDPIKPLTLENDACEYDIASALLRGGKPIAFASRSLSECERRYAQIEKEILASLNNVPEKFHHYTFGKQAFVVIDHKSTSVTNHSTRLPHISASMLGESILKCGSLTTMMAYQWKLNLTSTTGVTKLTIQDEIIPKRPNRCTESSQLDKT